MEPMAMVYFIVDYLQGTVKKGVPDEVYRQRDGPQSVRLMVWLKQGFKSKRTLEEVKIVMPTLSHEWGKVYVYLSEFNLLSKDPAALRRYKKAIVNVARKTLDMRGILWSAYWKGKHWRDMRDI